METISFCFGKTHHAVSFPLPIPNRMQTIWRARTLSNSKSVQQADGSNVIDQTLLCKRQLKQILHTKLLIIKRSENVNKRVKCKQITFQHPEVRAVNEFQMAEKESYRQRQVNELEVIQVMIKQCLPTNHPIAFIQTLKF